MQTVRNYLVYEYVPIMVKTFINDTRDSCVAQRSIYVILRGNEEARSYIKQVRIKLRLLISDILHNITVIQRTHFTTISSFDIS